MGRSGPVGLPQPYRGWGWGVGGVAAMPVHPQAPRRVSATVTSRHEGDDKRAGINPLRAPGRNNEEDLTGLRNQLQPTPFGAALFYFYLSIFSSAIVQHKAGLMVNPTRQALT